MLKTFIIAVFSGIVILPAVYAQTEEDSLALFLPQKVYAGEFYIRAGYMDAVRSNSSYTSRFLMIGGGVEMIPGEGKWGIGAAAAFGYKHKSRKLFKNLFLPHVQVYTVRRVWAEKEMSFLVGGGVSWLTNVYSDWMEYSSSYGQYYQESGYQNYVSVLIKSLFRYKIGLGKRKKAALRLGLFLDLDVPVIAYSDRGEMDRNLLPYANWAHRFGIRSGVRVGIGK
ncbi:hypothetical protein GCM10009118_26380 [Wandonia haliotis]|uniref:DUF3575 domain-containing protein n=1 Tax=Wandonia haliotis TaxID=574963 RepID=A0ABP3Y609_9FLAO